MQPPAPLDAPPSGLVVRRVRFTAGEHSHPPSGLFELRVVRQGSSHAQIDLGAGPRQVFTRPGDVLVSLGDRPTLFVIEDSRDLDLIQATRGVLNVVLDQLGADFSDLAPVTDRPFRDPLIADVAGRMEALSASASMALPWAFGVLVTLTLEAARKRASSAASRHLTRRRLAEVETAIEAGLERSMTVAELAEIAGMNERAFAAAFREATGLPPYQSILRRRVERAVGLLRDTVLPLAEVAHRAGFAHQAHMTRVLKRLKGQTPQRIRANSDPL